MVRGMVRTKVGQRSTQARNRRVQSSPCSSTRFLTIHKPSPVPPMVVWKNGLLEKSWLVSSLLMPGPVSACAREGQCHQLQIECYRSKANVELTTEKNK